jgi:hypothetical protein
MRLFADNATSTLASAIDASVTTITLATGEGGKFPSPTGGDFFDLTLTQELSESSWEIVKVTERTGDTLTVTRGQYGTTASGWGAGSKAENRLHKAALNDLSFIDRAETLTAAKRGEVTALTDGANIAPNFDDSNFFSVTLAGNRTLGNPSNLVAGQSGSIFITQDATGSRTLAYGSYWDFAGGTAPSLSTVANTVDRLDYVVRSSTSIHAQLSKAWS